VFSAAPGGKKEPGESKTDTAAREIMEETGADITTSNMTLVHDGAVHNDKTAKLCISQSTLHATSVAELSTYTHTHTHHTHTHDIH